ncbi:MAG TPA: serine/threonine-protein kinase [Bryobacteraceae bacterium]|nr:serine/threonine-protein kinase [Bryobacteraceae bacterium]
MDTVTSGQQAVYPTAFPDSSGSGRFATGAVVAGRYRIVSLAGRGGMGEVYRAYDDKLEQPVALKFLPAALSQDGAALARFHNEVRTARQVSHPNVCRVYDIGEWEGMPFLSMEYVDGEDLASLLRRIGRLAPDKAVEIARRLCAALAAAHEKGVLHRDFKPGNIMIDGRGQVLITDFGLAALAAQVTGPEARHGTPAYMAPEQLAGNQASARSDIYALGLVLYEMFTGRRAFDAQSRDELLRLEETGAPAGPSTLVRDLDPAVDRVILRCLEPDPARRPSSALSVAAALPGGDPLAAALAAGETPSPEMVAASSETAAVSVRLALALLVLAVTGVAAAAVLHSKADVFGSLPTDKSPEVLRERARDLLSSFGYTAPQLDSHFGFGGDSSYLDYVERHDRSPDRWARLVREQPPVVHFWYRQSPRYMEPTVWFGAANIGLSPSRTVSESNPALVDPGMILLEADLQGRLYSLETVPPEIEDGVEDGVENSVDDRREAASPPDWSSLFRAAGLDPARFSPTPPHLTPPSPYDARAAWLGAYAGQPLRSLRIEAAAWRGRPSYFRIVGPWTQRSSTPSSRPGDLIWAGVFVVAVSGGAMLARRNSGLGRGDRRGAFRLAAFVFGNWMLLWLIGSNHLPNFAELQSLLTGVSASLMWAAVLWVLYIALEPYVRRRWPQAIIGWSRMITGRLRDPIVGGEILVGTVSGVAVTVLYECRQLVRAHLGAPPTFLTEAAPVDGLRGAASMWVAQFGISMIEALLLLFLIFLFRLIARSEWGAGVLYCLLVVALNNLGISHAAIGSLFSAAGAALTVYILIRYGLVAVAVSVFVTALLLAFPLTLDFSKWYAGQSLLALGTALALAVFGFREALAGRAVLREDVLAR